MTAWAGLTAVASTAIVAVITWHGGTGSAWVSTGSGTHLLDIVQVGVRAGPQQPGGADYPDAGPHFFAAYGAGTPEDGEYTEVDLGPADTKPHRYVLRWSGTAWELLIDGHLRQRVTARTWTARNVRVMAEGHDGPLPRVRIEKVRRSIGYGWTDAGLSYIAVQVGKQSPAWGRDWISTYQG